MKRMILLFMAWLPLLAFCQTFSESMDKVQTVDFINKMIKPEGQQASFASNRTKINYTDNFFATNSRIQYLFDLTMVNFSTSGTKIVVTCKSGSCIDYSLQTPTNSETKKLSTFEFDTKDVSGVSRALAHLKKVTGAN